MLSPGRLLGNLKFHMDGYRVCQDLPLNSAYNSTMSSMHNFTKAVASLSIVAISAGPFSGGSTFAAPQKDSRCATTNIVERLCVNAMWIGPEREKPFIAERTSKVLKSSQGEVQILQEAKQFVARDSAGRIREESHVLSSKDANSPGKLALGGIPTSHSDLNTSTSLVDDPGQLTVSILDCFGGQQIQLTPETEYAIVQASCVEPPIVPQNSHSYSDRASQLIQATFQPGTTVEDLGYKRIDDIQSRGIRITIRGADKGGEWAGKPVSVSEIWLSDELGATLLWDYSDPKKGIESRASLTGIKRQEPDSSLFVVPSGYRIHHWK
jgi:hypothetical protein